MEFNILMPQILLRISRAPMQSNIHRTGHCNERATVMNWIKMNWIKMNWIKMHDFSFLRTFGPQLLNFFTLLLFTDPKILI